MIIWPEVASFGGNPDSRHYISWERDVDEYFRRNQMPEDRKIRFAQMHLRGSPEYYWNNVQGRLMYDRHEPIRTWAGMKCKLREKYAPGFDRPQSQPYHEPRRPLYRDPKPNPRRTLYPEPKPNLRERSHSIDKVQESFNEFQALLEEFIKKISEGTTKGNLEPETPEPIEKFVEKELEPISEPEEEVYEADLILRDEYVEEELEESESKTISSLPEDTLESHPVVEPSSEILEIRENQVPDLVPYPQEDLIVPAQAIIPYPLAIPPAPIENLSTELIKSSPSSIDPFLKMTKSSLLHLDLVPCLTPKVSPLISVEHPFPVRMGSSSPVEILLMAPDPFLCMPDLPIYRVCLSSPVGQILSLEVIIHRPFLDSFPDPFLEEVDHNSPRDRTLAATTSCFEPHHDSFLGLEIFPFRRVDHLTLLDHQTNLQNNTFSMQGMRDSTSYFLPFPRTSNASHVIQLNFVEVLRVSQLPEPIRFATYFWKTLWHLLGTHVKFSCSACPTGPRSSLESP